MGIPNTNNNIQKYKSITLINTTKIQNSVFSIY